MILGLLQEAVDSGARFIPACKVIGLDPRTVQRWKASDVGDDCRSGPRTKPRNALSEAERANILRIANTPEFRDKSPKQIVPLLADRGQFVASESTFYRVLKDANQLKHRSSAKAPTKRYRPNAYTATGPNQVWSWDITYLRASVKGSFYYLYMVLDVWSRMIVGHVVHREEDSGLAAILHGFTRLRCYRCGTDDLVAFSCKGRGFCPSCGGRRMVESAAHLVDHVLPQVFIRQWVISFPWALRYILARQPRLLSQVRRIFLRAVFGFYRKQARQAGLHRGRTGAVSRIQLFGSALNLNPHLHTLLLDGVYCAASPFSAPIFHNANDVTQDDVERLVRTIHSRVLRHLEQQGFLSDDGILSTPQDELQGSLLPLFQAASIRGQALPSSESPASVEKVFHLVPQNQRFRPPSLCAEFDGFSLHAATRIPATDRITLERLCRYIGRPPFSGESLTLDSTGRILFKLRRAWRDGTTQLRFDPLTFLSRLAALVPPPKFHFVNLPRGACSRRHVA